MSQTTQQPSAISTSAPVSAPQPPQPDEASKMFDRFTHLSSGKQEVLISRMISHHAGLKRKPEEDVDTLPAAKKRSIYVNILNVVDTVTTLKKVLAEWKTIIPFEPSCSHCSERSGHLPCAKHQQLAAKAYADALWKLTPVMMRTASQPVRDEFLSFVSPPKDRRRHWDLSYVWLRDIFGEGSVEWSRIIALSMWVKPKLTLLHDCFRWVHRLYVFPRGSARTQFGEEASERTQRQGFFLLARSPHQEVL